MTKSKMNKPKTTIKLSDIKTPTTVDEFRDNLRTNFVTINDRLLVKGGSHMEIPIKDIECLGDLYKITQTGWNGRDYCTRPYIIRSDGTPWCVIQTVSEHPITSLYPLMFSSSTSFAE